MVLETLEGETENDSDLEEARRLVLPQVPPTPTEETADAEKQGIVETVPSTAPPPEPPGPPVAMSESVLEEYGYERPKHGEVRKGVVVSVQPTEIIVDIGAKRECIIGASDLHKLGDEAVARIHEGDEVSVYIVKVEDREGHLIGSLHLAEMEADWTRAEEYEKSGEVFEARVSGQNRGGLLVPFGRLRGFVPASHLVGMNNDSADRPVALGHWVGKTLPFKVIEVNRRRNRLILSYRAARRQWRSQQKKSLLDELKEGDVRKGVVSSLASFGAFVDLGGADGLIHVSELGWYRVEHPREVLQVGQEIEVYVLRVDRESGRIGLSLKRLQPDPWSQVDDKYFPDQLVEGTITRLVDFGAFAEIEKGVEGLIHITELAEPAPARPEDVVQVGQAYLLQVLRIDTRSRRIGLSLRRVDPQQQEAWRARKDTEPASTPTDEAADASENPVG